LQKA
jgi:hypothetical protein